MVTTGGVPRCLTVAELATRLRVSRKTVSRALSAGSLEHYRIGARAVIPEPAALAWVESFRIGSKPRRVRG